MKDTETGFIGPAECPACESETRFWMQANGHAMCPCSARRTFTAEELGFPGSEAGHNRP